MTGHQTKYNHILDRTFLRPRDIIQFTNDILRVHKENEIGSGLNFTNKNVIDARSMYSNYLLGELDNEIRKHHPNYEAYLEVFRTIGSLQFTIDDFEKTVSERSDLD